MDRYLLQLVCRWDLQLLSGPAANKGSMQAVTVSVNAEHGVG